MKKCVVLSKFQQRSKFKKAECVLEQQSTNFQAQPRKIAEKTQQFITCPMGLEYIRKINRTLVQLINQQLYLSSPMTLLVPFWYQRSHLKVYTFKKTAVKITSALFTVNKSSSQRMKPYIWLLNLGKFCVNKLWGPHWLVFHVCLPFYRFRTLQIQRMSNLLKIVFVCVSFHSLCTYN